MGDLGLFSAIQLVVWTGDSSSRWNGVWASSWSCESFLSGRNDVEDTGAGTQIDLSQCVRQRPVKSQVASLRLEMSVNASGGRRGRSHTQNSRRGGNQEYIAESQ